jgi:hypothetical protein
MTRHRKSKIETFSSIVLSLALATLTACGHSSQVEVKAASNDQPHDSSELRPSPLARNSRGRNNASIC